MLLRGANSFYNIHYIIYFWNWQAALQLAGQIELKAIGGRRTCCRYPVLQFAMHDHSIELGFADFATSLPRRRQGRGARARTCVQKRIAADANIDD